MNYEHLSREELLAELRKAGPPSRIKQEVIDASDVIVLDADPEESPIDNERKRKRDPDTPKKKKRPPPELRQVSPL
jgi:hypothetical protein